MAIDITALMGHPKDDSEMEDAPPSSKDVGGDEDFEDLTPAQVVEHLHASSEAAIKACQEGSPVAFAKALEAMVKLIELKGDHEDSGAPEDDGDTEEAPTEGMD
jgi:hypothetical protein